MHKKKGKKVKAFLGILFIFFGIIGWLLPFVPGTLFILAGLLLLHVQWITKIARKYACKYGLLKNCIELTE